MRISRRGFMQSSFTYLSAASTVPLWLQKASASVCAAGLPEDRVLVILQQAGGNDGLNTVIPYTDPKYLETGSNGLRPTLHIINGLAPTELGDNLNALHPRLLRLKNWYSNGNVAVVQNVGYPNPNLSHFTATDLWELGLSPSSGFSSSQGWVSRYFDNQCGGMPPDVIEPLHMVAAGMSRVPLTLANSNAYLPPAVSSFGAYSIQTPASPATWGPHLLDYIGQASMQNVMIQSQLDFVQRAANVTQMSVNDMGIAALTPTLHPYPANSNTLGPGLEMVSRVIRTQSPRLPTRIFYVTQGGYDTHANQFNSGDSSTGVHADLLDELDQALDAFLQEMADSGNLDRVTAMTFSEFGRRPQENGSRGSDHGTANCLFVAGGRVNGGVYGGQPDLVNLLSGNQGGNLQHQVDFRSVLSVVLQDWLGSDPEQVFGPDFMDAAFTIASGMAGLPLFNNEGIGESEMPASSSSGLAAAALLAAAAGAMALRNNQGVDKSHASS